MAQGASFAAGSLARGLRNFPKYTRDGIHARLSEVAKEVEQYAKSNAPWEDRSGDARRGLTAAVSDKAASWRNNTISIVLYHSVSYGVWLETRWGGQYAIIVPTLETMGPKVMNSLDGLISEIVYYA